jgi:hypothetical protein
MKYYDNMSESEVLELMEQIRAEDEAYASFYNSAEEFCGCDDCQSWWDERDLRNF